VPRDRPEDRVIMVRYRIYYEKTENLQYTSNLDIQKIWERTLRRAQIPIQYSQGFHPQPKIQLACPLPLGMTSIAEIMDFWALSEVSQLDLMKKILAVIHTGFVLKAVEIVPLDDPALQSQLQSLIYRISVPGENPIEIKENINNLLSKEHITRTRREKSYDLRLLIEECELVDNQFDTGVELMLQLSARSGATGRPEDVLEELGIDRFQANIERYKIIFSPR
jgi:radical SAM-linked protein